jgi:SAM-dependent methyltransferase
MNGRETLVFDYGCGRGGDWPDVLGDYPYLSLAFYDPDDKALAEAVDRLAGRRAKAVSWTRLTGGPPLEADFVVSLSVLEHVYRRRTYLRTAWRHLKPGGLLFLNYDDGHFRIRLDPARPLSNLAHFKELARNLFSPPLAKLGRIGRYQRRVSRREPENMALEIGFVIEGAFYSNLESLKGFYSELESADFSAEDRQMFARKWLDLELLLNRRFMRHGREIMGDTANIWPFASSRTLVLRRPAAGPLE